MERLANAKTPEDILQYLRGVQFPAHKHDLVHAARKSGAPNDIVGALGQLPTDKFNSPEELIAAYPRFE